MLTVWVVWTQLYSASTPSTSSCHDKNTMIPGNLVASALKEDIIASNAFIIWLTSLEAHTRKEEWERGVEEKAREGERDKREKERREGGCMGEKGTRGRGGGEGKDRGEERGELWSCA